MGSRVNLPVYESGEQATAGLLIEQYADYQRVRDQLHALELQGEQSDSVLVATLAAKEQLAYTTLALFSQSRTIAGFERSYRKAIAASAEAQEDALRMGTDDPVLGAYIHPLALSSERSVSPTEAALTTLRNLSIADAFSAAIESSADCVLLSGSTAWGSFYAVRGGVPLQLQRIGVPQLEFSALSDVDLVVIAKTDEALGVSLEQLVNEGIVDSEERERFGTFLELRKSGEADIFSVRSYTDGVQKSIHFVPDDILDIIYLQTPYRQIELAQSLTISTLYDFRPNAPKSVSDEGGYLLGDLRGMTNRLQPVQLVPVVRGERMLGYISRTPIGGPTRVDDVPTYIMGVASFLTNVHPIVLFDRDGTLKARLSESQQRIARTLGGQPAVNVMRRQRMPKRVLEAILNTLSLPT